MKARRTALVVCGLLLMVLGSASAAYVGPDDTLMIGSHRVGGSATGQAVRTHPAITDFVNINLLVRAEAPSGVFLGTAHRVDTVSFLEGRRHWTISRMALGNVGGRMTEGAKPSTREALRPERLLGWLDSDAGEDVELTVPLTGEPIDVVAVPYSVDERVRISIGANVQNLFVSQLGVVGVGAVLIALSFVLGWWVRRKETSAGRPERGSGPGDGVGPSTGAHRHEATGAGLALPKLSPTTGAPPPSTPLTPPPSTPRVPSVPAASVSAPVLPDSWEEALAAAALAKGKTRNPEGSVSGADPVVPAADPEPSSPGSTDDSSPAPVPEPPSRGSSPTHRRFKRSRFLFLVAVFPLARVVRRRSAHRRSLQSLVLISLALLLQSCAVPGPAASNNGSLSRTGLSLAEAGQLVDNPVDVYTPEFMSYPMWALIATSDPDRVQLRTRDRFTAKWRAQDRVRLAKRSQLPTSVRNAIPPGPILVERAETLAGQVGEWWSTGEIDGVSVDGRTKKARRLLLSQGVAPGQIYVWPATDTAPVRIVEVAGGHVVWLTHTVSTVRGLMRLTTVAMLVSNARSTVLGSRLAEVDQTN